MERVCPIGACRLRLKEGWRVGDTQSGSACPCASDGVGTGFGRIKEEALGLSKHVEGEGA